MTGNPGALPEHPSSDPTEARVERVAEGYIEALEAGEPVDRAAFVSQYPDIAEALERRLALIDAFRALAGPPPEPEASGAIEVRCPHCDEPVAVDGSASGSAVCTSCGNGFRISGRADPFIAGGASSALGRYRLLEVVGRGAFGIVYRALDTELDRIVAVKVPRRSDWEDSEEETRRLFREARSTARLKHPGIVAVHDFGLEAGTPFIVCELIEGGTLSDRLKKGRLPLREAARLIVSVARALAHAHEQGVIHRDIKPGNILLDQAGFPHLGDFGLARRQEGEITVTLEGQILGTPAYMSPEQAAGSVDVDARSDIYSLGTVLYELITGQLPFSGGRSQVIFQVLHEEPRPPRSVQPLIPRDLETICLGAVEKDPRRRLSSAGELADELERYLAGRPIRSRPTGRWGKLTRWAARSPVTASLTGLVAVLLLALGVGSTIAAFSMRRANQATQRALEESESRLVQLEVLQGIESSDSGDLPAAILRYTEALSRTRGSREEEALRALIGTTLSHQPALRQIWLLPPRTRCLRFDPEGRLLAYAAGTEAVVLECSTGKRLRTFQMSRGACAIASFSRTGSRIATGDAGGIVTIWSLEDGAAVARARRAANIVDVLFLAGDERILIASRSGRVSIWNTTNGATERSVRLETPILQMAADTDGKRAVVLGADGAALLWSGSWQRPRCLQSCRAGAPTLSSTSRCLTTPSSSASSFTPIPWIGTSPTTGASAPSVPLRPSTSRAFPRSSRTRMRASRRC
ncbi:MAG TPA: serine/threonine-protein kinase [Planctomycetota bacterium]|nr:serine/threonine-protein kinase [Planctomycetota bacterium]